MAHPVPPREPWEYDRAHQACNQWIQTWRQNRPDADRPPLAFAKHLGNCARDLADGTERTALLRLYAAAGHDGACPCGERPGIADPNELEALAS